MNYPLISEYIDAIKSAEDNFDQLNYLRPVFDDDGNPVMSSGNFAVVFKMTDGEKYYAIKCFIKEQEGRDKAYKLITDFLKDIHSPYITPCRFYDKELFVDTSQSMITEFPVLLMDWIDGDTLTEYLCSYAVLDDYCDCLMTDEESLYLTALPYKFELLADWLKNQDFAHGDIKPDNIIVCNDGSLKLIDYDGMYVPSMKGQLAREMGSPDFRHPDRSKYVFNKDIDDFALISISLSLELIAGNHKYLLPTGDLLFKENDYKDFFNSKVYQQILPDISKNTDIQRIFGLFLLCMADGNLKGHTILVEKESIDISQINTKVNDEDMLSSWTDEFGVRFNKNGSKLISCENDLDTYTVPSHVKIICDKAFNCNSISSIKLNKGLLAIGEQAFCCSLDSVVIPETVVYLGDECFMEASGMGYALIKGPLQFCGSHVFAGGEWYTSLREVILCEGVQCLGAFAFNGCPSLHHITLPSSLQKVGTNPFQQSGIKTINNKSPYFKISDGLIYTIENGNKTLVGTYGNLFTVNIDEDTERISCCALQGCDNLKYIILPKSIKTIENAAIVGCKNLKYIVIDSKLNTLAEEAFFICDHIEKIYVKNNEKIYNELCLEPTLRGKVVKVTETMILDFEVEEVEEVESSIKIGFSTDHKKIMYYRDIYKTEYAIPEGTEIICDNCFNDLFWEPDGLYLKELILPSSLRLIGEDAFCGGIEKIQNDSPFFQIYNDMLLSYDKKILYKYFGRSKFVHIPLGVEVIEGTAFTDMVLTQVIIPITVIKIKKNPFACTTNYDRQNMSILCYSWNFTVKDGCLYDRNLEHLISCFEFRKTLILPNSIQTIGENAFFMSKPDNIYLGDNIKYIESSSFINWIDKIYIPRCKEHDYRKLLGDISNLKLYDK